MSIRGVNNDRQAWISPAACCKSVLIMPRTYWLLMPIGLALYWVSWAV